MNKKEKENLAFMISELKNHIKQSENLRRDVARCVLYMEEILQPSEEYSRQEYENKLSLLLN